MNDELLTPGTVIRHGWEQPFFPGGPLPRFVTSIESTSGLVWHNVTDPQAVASEAESYVRTDIAPGIVQITWKEPADATNFGVVWTLDFGTGRIHGIVVNADPTRNLVLSGDFVAQDRTVTPASGVVGATQAITDLASRQGSRPVTGDALPHLQFTDNSPQAIYDELAEWLFALDGVTEAPSTISIRGTRGAIVSSSESASGEYEFTHIHPMDVYGGGSQHLALLHDDAEALIAKGWAEYHPMNLRAFPEQDRGLVLLYAPRDADELEVVKTVTLASYALSRSAEQAPQSDSGS